MLRKPIGAASAAKVLGPSQGSAAASIEERLGEKRRARMRLGFGRLLTALFVLVVVGTLAWVALFSPVFALQLVQVKISGTDEHNVTSQEVLDKVSQWVDVPLPRLDTAQVEASVETIVRVDSATVTRRWPAGLEVTIVQRTAVMVEASEAGWSLVDDEGVAFAHSADKPADLPEVSLPAEDRETAAAEVMEVWNAIDPALRAVGVKVTHDGRTLNLRLDTGQSVKWGTPGDTELKAQVLQTLMAQRLAKVYDVSAPTNPVIS